MITQYGEIPDRIKSGIDRYVDNHEPTGGFLKAVLTNDLKEAVFRADPTSLGCLRAIVMYCHWEIPSNSWGTFDRYNAWTEKRAAYDWG